MNINEKIICTELVQEFNELVTTPTIRLTEDYRELCIDLVKQEEEEFWDALKEDDGIGVIDAMCDLFVVLTQAISCPTMKPAQYVPFIERLQELHWLADNSGVPYHACVLAVCKSNLSKVPLLEDVKEMYGDDPQVAMASASDWIESQGRYKDVYGTIIKTSQSGLRVVFKCSTGKVVKPWCFSEPSF